MPAAHVRAMVALRTPRGIRRHLIKSTSAAGAYEALQRLKEDHELAVVTSRQFAIQEATLEWIYRTYPDTFDSVHFGNHWAKAGMSRKKSEICRQIGADVLIDDNPMYAYDCASAGMQVLLFNWDLAYPWSQQPDECDSPVDSAIAPPELGTCRLLAHCALESGERADVFHETRSIVWSLAAAESGIFCSIRRDRRGTTG